MKIYKFSNYSKILYIILSVITLLCVFLFSYMIYDGVKDSRLYFGIFFFMMLSLIFSTFPFFCWLESDEEKMQMRFYGILLKLKPVYEDIKDINDFLFNSSLFRYEKDGILKVIYQPNLKNQVELFHKIIEKNPECIVSKKIAKQLRKKYGEVFYKKLNIK
jgi:hypothetical protein